MIRILVVGLTANPGGMESFVLAYYRHMDRQKVQLDFLGHEGAPIAYEEELLALGARTFYIEGRYSNRARFREQLDELFRNHASEWNAVWENVCSLANIDYLKAAKKYGVPRRIIHSHNSQNMDSFLRGVLHHWYKCSIQRYATDFWACSEEAAHWFYKDALMPKAVVIRNAIDVESMRYAEEKRARIRAEYGWEDQFVIGHVGRLHFQKNQSFAIDVFQKYHHKNSKSVLVFVGQGEDEDKLKEQAATAGVEKQVYFVGVQKDIQAWLSSFDLFLFPSKFEGLGIAALEAEANGLPVLAADRVIPQEVKINENFAFCDLTQSPEEWADEICRLRETERERFEDIRDRFAAKGYDIEKEAGKLECLLVDGDGKISNR